MPPSGKYHVLLPDGRIQTVSYTVDAYNGYVADVRYSGEAKYDVPKPTYNKPSYEPTPKPSYEPTPKPTYKPTPVASYKPTPLYKPQPKPTPKPHKPIVLEPVYQVTKYEAPEPIPT